ncbi:hypothetical protein CNR22_16345 [Sphingobacteriaceae bacterium]|nr:hypothetical protein CNR22_16345 [Sphingobacteriaceae bacterium]
MATLAITLQARIKPVFKFGFILQLLLLFSTVSALMYLAITFSTSTLLVGLLISAFFFAALFVSKRYFEKFLFTEKIIVSYSKITIVHKSFFNEVKHEFLLRDVYTIGFLEIKDSKIIENPKKEPIILVKNACIELETENKIFRFGKNASSQETDEVVKKIEDHLGRTFNKRPKETSSLKYASSLV